MPPIWEYGTTDAYRPFNDLSGDLAKVIRYVAIDMLFTPSPIYDPAATVPGPDGAKAIQVDVFEGDPASNGLGHIACRHHRGHLARPRAVLRRHGRHHRPAAHRRPARRLQHRHRHAATPPAAATSTTWGPLGFPEAELDCYFSDHRAQYFPVVTGHRRDPRRRLHRPAVQLPLHRQLGCRLPDRLAELHHRARRRTAAGLRPACPADPGARSTRRAFRRAPAPLRWLGLQQGRLHRRLRCYNFAWDGDETATPMSYLYGQGSLTFSGSTATTLPAGMSAGCSTSPTPTPPPSWPPHGAQAHSACRRRRRVRHGRRRDAARWLERGGHRGGRGLSRHAARRRRERRDAGERAACRARRQRDTAPGPAAARIGPRPHAAGAPLDAGRERQRSAPRDAEHLLPE